MVRRLGRLLAFRTRRASLSTCSGGLRPSAFRSMRVYAGRFPDLLSFVCQTPESIVIYGQYTPLKRPGRCRTFHSAIQEGIFSRGVLICRHFRSIWRNLEGSKRDTPQQRTRSWTLQRGIASPGKSWHVDQHQAGGIVSCRKLRWED